MKKSIVLVLLIFGILLVRTDSIWGGDVCNAYVEEGEDMHLNDCIKLVNSTFVLTEIGKGEYVNDETTFIDINNGNSFKTTTGLEGSALIMIYCETYYIKIHNAETDNASIVLTWGDGANYDDIGSKKGFEDTCRDYVEEGWENMTVNDCIITPDKTLKLCYVSRELSEYSSVVFHDFMGGDIYEFITGIDNFSCLDIDNRMYYAEVYEDKYGPETDNHFVSLTWEDDETDGGTEEATNVSISPAINILNLGKWSTLTDKNCIMLEIATDKDAICNYGLCKFGSITGNPSVGYGGCSILKNISTTGGTLHSQLISDLDDTINSETQSEYYDLRIKCGDNFGSSNIESVPFYVNSNGIKCISPTYTYPIDKIILMGNRSVSLEEAEGLLDVEFKRGDKNVAEFEYNFTNGIAELDDVVLEQGTEENGAVKGYLFVRGIDMEKLLGKTKTLYINNINNNLNWVCIKDADISSIDEITSNCKGDNEYHIQCNGQEKDGYACTYDSNLDQYKITGLKHSGVIQMNEPEETDNDNNAGSSGGGGSLGGGGGGCLPNWQCSDWSECSSERKQTRTCTDKYNCAGKGNSYYSPKPTEEQDCEYILETIKAEKIVESEDSNRNLIGITGAVIGGIESKVSTISVIAMILILVIAFFFMKNRVYVHHFMKEFMKSPQYILSLK